MEIEHDNKIKATDANIDYRKQMMDKYDNYIKEEPVDDSFIQQEDKYNLIETAKYIVNTHYKQYPAMMSEILIKRIYNDCIKNLNKNEYLQEIENKKNKSILDLELSKIDKFSGL
tara:strand:- start:137 stop:481 length:345 start_codon:yes stop_codon:yes gene_type:complete